LPRKLKLLITMTSLLWVKTGGDDTKTVAVEIATQARVNFLFPPLQRVTLGLVDMADFSQSST
jgi:hypothetical protein